MILNRDFKEFIRSLNENNVEYLVIGGYAVAFHGNPRYTKDLDIWIRPSETNAKNILNALADFGFGSLDLKIDDFLGEDDVIQLGYPPNRIDLVGYLQGVEFDKCYSSRVIIEIEGVDIKFIDLENLKKNKRATGRHQDLADLENLE